jgi:hypothetical protein
MREVRNLKIVEQLCRFFCGLVGWQLPGKSILLEIDDTDDPALFGLVVRGTIYAVVRDIVSTGPGGSSRSDNPDAIIRLDSPLNFKNQETEWLVARPRHIGFSLDRLYLTSIAVYIHALDGPNPPAELAWDDIIAICSMKLTK